MQPDFADRGERRHRVPQLVDGHAPADGDRRRVKQFLQSRAGEGGAGHGPTLVVDDQLAGAADAVALGVRAGNLAGRRAHHGDPPPRGPSLRGRQPDGAHLRVGERHPGDDEFGRLVGHVLAQDGRGGDAAVILAHVGERGEPVAVADRVQPASGYPSRPQPPVHPDGQAGL